MNNSPPGNQSGDFPRILEKREEILLNLEEIGCPYITLDMEGFRSGSMDI